MPPKITQAHLILRPFRLIFVYSSVIAWCVAASVIRLKGATDSTGSGVSMGLAFPFPQIVASAGWPGQFGGVLGGTRLGPSAQPRDRWCWKSPRP